MHTGLQIIASIAALICINACAHIATKRTAYGYMSLRSLRSARVALLVAAAALLFLIWWKP